MSRVREFLQKINIRAELLWDEPMSLHTTFHIGGPADALVRPADTASALALVREARAGGMPLFTLGGGANILVGDRGIRGIVLDTSRLRSTRLEADSSILIVGPGLSIDELCLEALSRGLGGLEDFAGLPGSVGGAVYMNARCYEREFSQVLAWTLSAPPEGEPRRRRVSAAQWSYKRSPFQAGGPASGELLLEAAFSLRPLDDSGAARAASVMRGRRLDREAKGHYRLPSAGSMFKNDRSFGSPTGAILDRLGLRGRRIGDAMVSPWHANIFVNAGNAKASDMLALIELARDEVRSNLGFELESEVLMVGDFA